MPSEIDALRVFYGPQPVPPADLFQFLLWEILSHKTLPSRRDLAWQALKRLPALTPDAMHRASPDAVRSAVALTGAGADKRHEQARVTVAAFRRHRDMLAAGTWRAQGLLAAGRALRHVAPLPPAVRRRALLFAGGFAVCPMDDEVSRVIGRLTGRAGRMVRTEARRWLASRTGGQLPALREALVYVRHHALQACVPVAPHCPVCPLREGCASARPALRETLS